MMSHYIQNRPANGGPYEQPRFITETMHMILSTTLSIQPELVDFRLLQRELKERDKPLDPYYNKHSKAITPVHTSTSIPYQLALFAQEEESLLDERERATLVTTRTEGLHLVGEPPFAGAPVIIVPESISTLMKQVGQTAGDRRVLGRYSPGAEAVVLMVEEQEDTWFTVMSIRKLAPKYWSLVLPTIARKVCGYTMYCSPHTI